MEKARCFSHSLHIPAMVPLLLMMLLLGGCLAPKSDAPPPAVSLSTNQQRIDYLAERGWEVKEKAIETLELQLPEELSDDYGDYCAMQAEQKLPFADYAGAQVTRCTYRVTNYPDRPKGVQVNLYLCDNVLIGGDIIAMGEDGFQRGLAFPEA